MADEEDIEVEEEEEEQEEIEDDESEIEPDGGKKEKVVESPADRATRLTRQANQARKKQGLPPLVEEKTVEKVAEKKEAQMSQTDIIAIVKADVPEEDVNWIQKHAQADGISVAEALKKPEYKTFLKERAEERKTADATQTTVTRRTAPKEKTGQELLKDANEGKLPESKDDMDKMIKQRLDNKSKK